MRVLEFLFLAILTLSGRAFSGHTLLARSTSNAPSYSPGGKVCGAYCIPGNHTCCPDLEGGCSPRHICQKGDNAVYGCCPIGETCTSDGGAEFIDDDGDTSGSGSSATTGTKTTSSTGSVWALDFGLVLAMGISIAALAALG